MSCTICPDDCHRGSTSRYLDGPIVCGSCRGIRTDLHAEIAVTEERYRRGYEWHNAWALAYGDRPYTPDEWRVAMDANERQRAARDRREREFQARMRRNG